MVLNPMFPDQNLNSHLVIVTDLTNITKLAAMKLYKIWSFHSD